MKRILALGTMCSLMSGCSHLLNVPTAYTSLPRQAVVTPSSLPEDVSNASLPPVVVPGQVRTSTLRQTSIGVDPSAALRASTNARAAWMPLKPHELTRPPAFVAGSGSAKAAAEPADPTSTGSVSAQAKDNRRQGAVVQSYDREATMDRLEREGRKDAKSICGGC